MVDVHYVRVIQLRHYSLRISDESCRGIGASAALARIIRCLRADDDLCAFGENELCRLSDVGVEGLYDQAGRGGACLGGVAGTIAAAVVGRVRRAAVVVSKFDEHVVASCDLVGHIGKAAFDGVGAGRAAGYCVVDDLIFKGVLEPLPPAWNLLGESYHW
jgi:hypothetical protein